MSTDTSSVTLVRNAIHNPGEPRHFMRVLPCPDVVVVRAGDVEIGRSARATEVREVAYDIYPPVFYLPRDDLVMARLRANPRSTHCPLKGDTEYFDIVTDEGLIAEAAWSYVDVIERAAALQGLVAFDTRKVEVSIERTR
ncbi:MAG: DUF427 domain-containing protein [Gammaproteobacteria bacterium]